MDYNDYKKASEKHLSTCKTMMDVVNSLDPNHQALIMGQKQKLSFLLHNVYYLSGYTLECIINYGIFKHFKWTKPSVKEIDHGFSRKCGLSFFQIKQLNKPSTYPYIVHKHDFSRNVEILRREFSTSKIPLIDKNEKVDGDVLKLFKSWKVEVRYHPSEDRYDSIVLNVDNVGRFVDTTDKVFNGIMKIIG